MKIKRTQPTLALKPTQFAVGILEIQAKVEELEKLSKGKLRKLLKETEIPVVISPQKELFLIDHHHFLFACWHLGVPKVKVKVAQDLSKRRMTFTQFWTHMRKSHFYYPYCQFGEGPRNPLYLPDDIRGLADDPYRSLAWFVRKEGGFENSDKPFAEFKWANFFRSKKLLDHFGRSGLGRVIEKAVKLARSAEARKLPGFIKTTQKRKPAKKRTGQEIAKNMAMVTKAVKKSTAKKK